VFYSVNSETSGREAPMQNSVVPQG